METIELKFYLFCGRNNYYEHVDVYESELPILIGRSDFIFDLAIYFLSNLNVPDNISKYVKDYGINIYTERRYNEGFSPRVVSAHSIKELIDKIKETFIYERYNYI